MAIEIKRRRAGTQSPWRERLKDKDFMLRASMLWSSRLLMLRGAFYILSAIFFPNMPQTRNHPFALMPQAELGASLAALGYFILKAVDDPRSQHLAVDALLSYCMISVIGFLTNYSRQENAVPAEWFAFAANSLACGLLLRYRSRESELRGKEGAPRELKEATRSIIASLRSLLDGPPRRPSAPPPPSPPVEPPLN